MIGRSVRGVGGDNRGACFCGRLHCTQYPSSVVFCFLWYISQEMPPDAVFLCEGGRGGSGRVFVCTEVNAVGNALCSQMRCLLLYLPRAFRERTRPLIYLFSGLFFVLFSLFSLFWDEQGNTRADRFL